MQWMTRENVQVDRVACPWLIQKFVDPEAEFIFVPGDHEILERECIVYDALYAEGQRRVALAAQA